MARQYLAALLLVVSCTALAQSANPFIGKWKVAWQENGKDLEASLVIEESGGSWETLVKHRKNFPCIAIKAPISMESTAPDTSTIHLKFNEALQGCIDRTLVLKRVDDKTVSGTLEGMSATLTRE